MDKRRRTDILLTPGQETSGPALGEKKSTPKSVSPLVRKDVQRKSDRTEKRRKDCLGEGGGEKGGVPGRR